MWPWNHRQRASEAYWEKRAEYRAAREYARRICKGERGMKAGDKVRVSMCSPDYTRDRDNKAVYVFIGDSEAEPSLARVCWENDVRYFLREGIYPVRHCKECGQELPEVKGG